MRERYYDQFTFQYASKTHKYKNERAVRDFKEQKQEVQWDDRDTKTVQDSGKEWTRVLNYWHELLDLRTWSMDAPVSTMKQMHYFIPFRWDVESS
jgi:hypothetical protein